MAGSNKNEGSEIENDQNNNHTKLKIICIGDSGVGKTKLLERYLMKNYIPIQHSTFALNIFRHIAEISNEKYSIDFWDTAGQDIFQSLLPSYYHQAHGCIMVFDAQRKITYQSLNVWYEHLRYHRPSIPVWCAVNKIDANQQITNYKFNFIEKNKLPLYYVSASTGVNVVKLFQDVIEGTVNYKNNSEDLTDLIIDELEKVD